MKCLFILLLFSLSNNVDQVERYTSDLGLRLTIVLKFKFPIERTRCNNIPILYLNATLIPKEHILDIID